MKLLRLGCENELNSCWEKRYYGGNQSYQSDVDEGTVWF
jgi:hypothetical protein